MRGAREARPLSLTEDPRLPKDSEGSQGFLRSQGRSQEPRETQGGSGDERGQEGARGSEGGEGEQGKHCS